MNNNLHQIVIGIDFGLKRIGIAVGQTITKTARPLDMVKANNGEPQWEMLDKIIKTWQPNAIIIGIPLNMDGTEQTITGLAKEFAEKLKKRYEVPVHGIDERLTTREARDQLFTKGGYKALQNTQIDSVAAQLILETWFMQIES